MKPNPKTAKKNPKLVVTGSDALALGGAAVAMLLTGAGVVAARPRES